MEGLLSRGPTPSSFTICSQSNPQTSTSSPSFIYATIIVVKLSLKKKSFSLHFSSSYVLVCSRIIAFRFAEQKFRYFVVFVLLGLVVQKHAFYRSLGNPF